MEEKPDYFIDAQEMIGNGYQPAAVIDPPRTVKALSEGGLVDYQVWGWVKMSAKFIAHMRRLKDAKLGVWQVIALSIDETGKCRKTIKEICELTDYSRTEVNNSIRELEEMGYLTVQRDPKGNIYDPEFVARGELSPSEGVVQKVAYPTGGVVHSSVQGLATPAIEKSLSTIKSIKRVNPEFSENLPLEWYILHNQPVPEHLTEKNAADLDALNEFESALGFGSLPWDTTTDWQAFKKWVIKVSRPGLWRDYAEWRKNGGKYEAMSNKQIRQNPRMFIDTGYPAFEAHSTMSEPLRLL